MPCVCLLLSAQLLFQPFSTFTLCYKLPWMHCAILGTYTLLAILAKKVIMPAYPSKLNSNTTSSRKLSQIPQSDLDTTSLPTYFPLSQHLRAVDLSILSPVLVAGKELSVG